MASTSLVLAGGALFFWMLIQVVKKLNSPLNRIPNAHFTAPFSRLWLVWIRARGREITICHGSHQRLGPVIRIGPNEISINCLENGVQTVYNTNWDKAKMYGNFVNYGHHPLFAIVEGKPHAERKRIFSGIYSKTTIDNSAELKSALETFGKVLQHRIKQWRANCNTVNMFPITEAYNMDVITSYLYGNGNGTRWLENDAEALPLLNAFQTVLEPWVYFAFTEIETLVDLASKIGVNLIPARVFRALEIVHPYSHKLTKDAMNDLEAKRSQNLPVPQALRHLKNKIAESKIPESQHLDLLASDLLDQIHAAHEATGIVLTFAMWHLSRNQEVQSKLRGELGEVIESGRPVINSEFLEYVLMETIRLHPAAFGPFPRAAPAGAKVVGFEVPAGTIVSASPYCLGRNSEIFSDPEVWKPSRWKNASLDQRRSMRKWVWMFTSGSRMCIGEHLAMISMKSFLAEVYAQHKTVIVRESSMKQLESFIAIPEDSSLFLRFESP